MSEPILRVKGLRAQIAGQQVVEDVSLEVPSTGVTALLGRNGVGKTSTVKGILGLIERSGEIEFAGERIDREPTHRIVQRGIGYVPEDREVFASLRGLREVTTSQFRMSAQRFAFFAAFSGSEIDAAFSDAIASMASVPSRRKSHGSVILWFGA